MNKKLSIIPLLVIVLVTIIITIYPGESFSILESVRLVLIDKVGIYYIVLGVLYLLGCTYFAFSRYGKIKLGKTSDKKMFSDFEWSAMVFTSTMAADIVYFSFHEWMYYFDNPGILGDELLASITYPLHHWGFIPWSIYLLPAVAYGYMIHNKSNRSHTISSACSGIVKNTKARTIIDSTAIVGLLLAVSTTFTVTTPLMTKMLGYVGLPIINERVVSSAVLVAVLIIYGSVAYKNSIDPINTISKISTVMYGVVLLVVLLFGGQLKFIMESAVTGLGSLVQNFIPMTTQVNPLRSSPELMQDWTIFYWSYWIAWSVANPFFIASISKGRTIREVIGKGFLAGLAGTFSSFIIFGNYGLATFSSGKIPLLLDDPSSMVISILSTLPGSKVIVAFVLITMLLMYITTFDALALVLANYTKKKNPAVVDDKPSKSGIMYWSVVLVILPIILLIQPESIPAMQSLSIISAVPISILVGLVIINFIKELKSDLKGGDR